MNHAVYEEEDYPLSGYPETDEKLDIDINDFQPTEDSIVANQYNYLFVDKDDDRPQMHSPEWSDWVMGQLTDDEKYNGKPICDGLRRIAIGLFGPMDILPPCVHVCNESYAAVTVTLKWPGRQISGSAEVGVNNSDAPFSQYPLGSAETRAQSRALRFALNLRKIVTAEEVSRKADISIPVTDDNRTEGGITDTQKKFIRLLCKKHDICVAKLIELTVGAHDSLDELTYKEAEQIQEKLDEWSKEKPEDVGPYDPSW